MASPASKIVDSPVANHPPGVVNVGYVSLHETLHPEHGTACLATAIREQHLAESKWSAVWAEATLVPEENVVEEHRCCDDEPQTTTNRKGKDPVDGGSIESETSTTTTWSRIPPWRRSNVFELIFGVVFSIAAVAATFGMELSAMVVFVIAAAFYNTADFCKRQNNIFMCFWWAVFGLVYMALKITDSILLIVSVFVAELLASLGFLLTAMSGNQGSAWHQYIRKLCHLTRWAFRDLHDTWWEKPKREFPLCGWSMVHNASDSGDNDAKNGGAVLNYTDAVVVEEVTSI